MNIFEFSDYVSYLKERILHQEIRWGYQRLCAEAAGCSSSFLSQVLKNKSYLGLEHTIALARFWKLSKSEEQYFLTLVLYSSAGTQLLKETLQAELQEMRTQNLNLKTHLDTYQDLDEQHRVKYYSAWYYAAVHVVCGVPNIRKSVQSISLRLKLEINLVKEILKELTDMCLVEQINGEWQTTAKQLHLPNSSQLNWSNHSNWRQHQLMNIQKHNKEELHYTGVYAMSLEDAKSIHTLLIDSIKEAHSIIAPSKEEDVYVFTCDFNPL